MSISVLRTRDAWWVQTLAGAARIDTPATTTKELLADRAAVEAARAATEFVPVESLWLLSPVTAPCRVVAQMTNFVSHVKDSGGDPATVPLTFFRKASGSISGPTDDIERPAGVQLLDYEVEIGLVIGREVPVGTTIDAGRLADFVADLVVTNDVSHVTSSCRKPNSTRRNRIRHSPRSGLHSSSSTPRSWPDSPNFDCDCGSTVRSGKT